MSEWLFEYEPFGKFFSEDLRPGLFAGFLTVATFIFSVKTFLLVTLQKDVYSDERYIRYHTEIQKEGLTDDSYLAPLRRLSDRLFFSTGLAFTASISQFTIGLIPMNGAALTCVLLGLLSVADLVRVYVIHQGVIKGWLDAIEDAQKKDPSP